MQIGELLIFDICSLEGTSMGGVLGADCDDKEKRRG